MNKDIDNMTLEELKQYKNELLEVFKQENWIEIVKVHNKILEKKKENNHE